MGKITVLLTVILFSSTYVFGEDLMTCTSGPDGVATPKFVLSGNMVHQKLTILDKTPSGQDTVLRGPFDVKLMMKSKKDCEFQLVDSTNQSSFPILEFQNTKRKVVSGYLPPEDRKYVKNYNEQGYEGAINHVGNSVPHEADYVGKRLKCTMLPSFKISGTYPSCFPFPIDPTEPNLCPEGYAHYDSKVGGCFLNSQSKPAPPVAK